MKLQYLGDEKDGFKWDYHDYLTVKLRCKLLNVVLMLDEDPPRNYRHAHPRIAKFCTFLHQKRCEALNSASTQAFRHLSELPQAIDRWPYKVELNPNGVESINFSKRKNQVVFIDPDTGFQPDGKATSKHVRFCLVGSTLGDISSYSVVSVYQDLIRIKAKDYCKNYWRIKGQLKKQSPSSFYSTAILWHGKAMFVIIVKLPKRLEKIWQFNLEYCRGKSGVELLDNPLSDSNIRQKEKK